MANEILKNMGFHHVALKCKDLNKSLAMYGALGLTEVARWGEGAGTIVMMDMGNGDIIEFFAKVLPNYDTDRVRVSDMRKVLSWYNILVNNGITEFVNKEEENQEETSEDANA